MNCSTPVFPVLHYLPKFAQTPVHWVGDAIQPSHPLPPLSPFAFSLSQHQSLFHCQLLASGGQGIGTSASESVRPMNIQSWFPLEQLVWSPCSPRDSQESSLAKFKSINSSILSLLYGPTLTFLYNYWKNHSFDYMDLCWQSDISAF